MKQHASNGVTILIDWKPWGEKSYRFIMNPIEKDARITILEGSVRSSKTVTMVPKWLEYIRRGPPGLLLMTGVSKETVYDNVLLDLFDTIGRRNYRYNHQTGELLVFWQNGNGSGSGFRRIKVIGARDEGSEKYLRGKTLAGAYCDELTLMPRSFFEQLLARLSVEGAKLYGTTNPDSPYHYLYTEYIDDDEKKDSGMVCDLHFTLDDNPNVPESYKEFLKKAYTGLFYDRLVLGLWVLGNGRIYDMFDESLLFDGKDLPDRFYSRAARYISIDYGTTNPMVFLDIYDDGETIWVMNEYYYDCKSKENHGRQKEDTQYADDLQKLIGEELPNAVIIDPSAASFKIVLRNRGYRIREADNAVLDGIRMVSSLLHRRLIRINRKCKNTRNEFASYVWDNKACLRGVEQPLKQNDHAMDALRYFIKTIIPKRRFGGEQKERPQGTR